MVVINRIRVKERKAHLRLCNSFVLLTAIHRRLRSWGAIISAAWTGMISPADSAPTAALAASPVAVRRRMESRYSQDGGI